MNHIHVQLKSVFKKAVDYDAILRNPCERVTPPKKDEPERKSLDMAGCMRFAEALDTAEKKEMAKMLAKEERMEKLGRTRTRKSVRGVCNLSCLLAFRIGLATGMRRGEIIALEWDGIDLEQQVITVTQSRTKSGEIKPPKTKAGMRTIHIDSSTCEKLKRWKTLQKKYLADLGIDQGDNTPVCCTDKGDYIDIANFERAWRIFKTDYGFEGLKFHELRHTQATQLLANGVDVKTVSSMLGHYSAGFTLDTYAHVTTDAQLKAAQTMGNILSCAV